MTATQDPRQAVLDQIDPPGKRPAGRNRNRFAAAAFLALIAVSATLAVVVLAVPMERQTIGLLVLALSVTLMMAGVHVAVAMALPSLLGLWVVGGSATLTYALEQIPRTSVASWSLSVIPMFVFMGLMISRAGLAEVVFHAAKQWIGGVPGGLGVATIFAGAGMSAASGSTLGVTYATSRIGIPEMLRAGYSPSMATGTVAMAGTLKMLIPPSITVVIYSGIAQTPVGPQLLAGVIPGAILALLFGLLIVVRGKLNPTLAPGVPMNGVTWRSRGMALLRAWPVALLLVIIVGGMQSGIATATESGAVAALSTILISGWMRRGDGIRSFLRQVVGSAMLTVGAVAAIMFLIISVNLLTMMIATSGVVQEVSTFVVELGLSRTAFLLALVVMYVVMGMFMDELAMLLLTVPVLLPILAEYDINLIWFGVFLIMLCEVGMVVPPVGFLSFVVHGIAQQPEVSLGHRISLMDVFRGVFWFVVVTIGLILLLVLYPDLALWLPSLSMGD